jgi:hypothetical protein
MSAVWGSATAGDAAGDGEGLGEVLTTTGAGDGEGLGEVFMTTGAGDGEAFITTGAGEDFTTTTGEGEALTTGWELGDTAGVGDLGAGEAGAVLGFGAGDGEGEGEAWVGAVDRGLTCWVQSRPMTLPGVWYWQTYVAQPHAVLVAQPSLVVDLQTSAVKCPVAVFQPGLLKSYSLTSLYQASTASDREE